MKTYLIYSVEGYAEYTPKDGLYHDTQVIEVIAPNEKEALARAKKLLKARYYKVRNVYEKFIQL